MRIGARNRYGLAKWKVPFRQIYCPTIRIWIAETIYEHVVLRLDP